jgi:hypothetical protein
MNIKHNTSMKPLLLLLFLSSCSYRTRPYDTIYFKNKTILNCTITNIDDYEVKYFENDSTKVSTAKTIDLVKTVYGKVRHSHNNWYYTTTKFK